jgi:Flp pilus assembly protein TadG
MIARRPSDLPARRRRRRLSRALVRDERGAVSAELVIATPLLLLLIMGVIQFALWQHAEHIASAVAQQGVAVGRLQGESAAAGQEQAQSVLGQLGSGVLVDSNITTARTNATTTVTVTGHAESIVGLFSLPVKAVATGPTETYTNPGQAP